MFFYSLLLNNLREKSRDLFTKSNLRFSLTPCILQSSFANGIEIIELITKADVVITAAGQTLNELAFMGVPSIAICIDKDQFFNIKTYCEKGFLLSELYWDDTELCGNAMKLLEKMKDARLRRILSKRGKELVDGSGVANILKISHLCYNQVINFNNYMEKIFKTICGGLNKIIVSLTIVGVLLLVLSFLTVWTDFMAKLVLGMVILLLAYALLSTAYRLWKFSQDLNNFWKIKK